LGQKSTLIVLLQLKAILCSAAQSPQMFRGHWSPLTLGYISQKGTITVKDTAMTCCNIT